MMAEMLFAFLPLGIWLVLVFLRGNFWLAQERDDADAPPAPAIWPSIVAIVPARNEADVIAHSIGSLLAQDYPGAFHIVLVDDQSSDGTADAARAAAHAQNAGDRLTILSGGERPPGWVGKLWAVRQGIANATKNHAPDYLLLTDADIGHTPDNLRLLVSRAVAGNLVLTSLMARLHCNSRSEQFLIPAFVYFFAMLFPFSWVNDRVRKTAAAAGGCMLVHRVALEEAGHIDAIKSAIIDDCALAALMKAVGPIWLGLTNRAASLRPYDGLGEIRRMVARSAYAQLSYSPLKLVGTLGGLALVYLAPPIMAIAADGPARFAAVFTWALMALSLQPMLRFYRASPFWGLALPLMGAFYAGFTLDSAIQFWRGRGGMWKGRAQAHI